MTYQFAPDPSIEALTEVYVPSLLYTAGYTVEVSSNLEWQVDEVNTQLLLSRHSTPTLLTS